MESLNLHRLRSDQKIKYVYSFGEGIIHDKRCKKIDKMKESKLSCGDEYLFYLDPCPDCEAQTYIRFGAKDPEEMNAYMKFFEKVEITTRQIREIYIGNHMQTRLQPNGLVIWHREDAWRLVIARGNRVKLYHNNYRIKKDGTREFIPGYHIQGKPDATYHITSALKIILNYRFRQGDRLLHKNM